ncbi:hypothetical protein TWF106_001553 [Orbilia oligospora]|uniref:GRIP domain-containing protein n=1 Tax=Orbilia oligospora TaxID=2813651 RepID=A0A7C8QA76_ORBOL|nr:hypothetical protein TWF106_001553 [Orbilia oligospora]
MDDSESGGTIGRKKGKKARKGTVRKLVEEIPKPQSESQNEVQGVEEPEGSPSTPPNSLEEGTEQSIAVIYSKDIATPTLRSGSETGFDKNAEKDRVFRLEAQLAQALAENAQLDDKYKGLLGRVASIRTTLTDRLNKDADLRQRFSVSQQNWSKEREEADIVQQRLKEELETTRKAGQDWEVLAMEESSVRRALEERVSDIEDQYISQKALLEKEISIKAQQAAKISDLQMALKDIQQTRKEELREIVESTQSQIEALVSEKTSLREELSAAEARSNHLSEEIQRMSHLESDVKEKTLLIGKLRHQGVILNEHLTKALRMIKRGDPQDNVDRQLVTNLFISFLGLPRGDQKRFEVLQLIANYLKWTDEDRETAGLSRPGGSGYPGPIPSRNIQSPLTLTHLSDSRDGNNSGENLAELWASFLQQQTETRPDGL